jgi:hypothetical protein
MEAMDSGDFVTGVGLYVEPDSPIIDHDIDEDALMRDISDTKYDDLAELRKMIKKT